MFTRLSSTYYSARRLRSSTLSSSVKHQAYLRHIVPRITSNTITTSSTNTISTTSTSTYHGTIDKGYKGKGNTNTKTNFFYDNQSMIKKSQQVPRSASFSTSAAFSHKEQDRLLVVGSGVAGSAAALIAAEIYKIPVTLIYAGSVPTDCNSYWAQGGIIYRNYDPESGDSAHSLAQDIHRAGAGLCYDPAVQKVSVEGPDRVRQLLLNDQDNQKGVFANVPFDRVDPQDPDSALSLCLEASHAAPRILHKADHTGRTITSHITDAVSRHPLITQLPHTIVTDLVVKESDHAGSPDVCVGVETLDRATGSRSKLYATRGTVLASGGLAGIYEHSTNPPGFNALGSSVALAVRASQGTNGGAEVQDLEYVQFHPTSLYIPNEQRFLLTEALRGEGAVLRDANGRAFAREYHEAGELAPRDIVARAVFQESQKASSAHEHNAFLDITHRDADWLHQRFPSIQEHLSQRGLDLAKDMLPIIPAAHYTCGGIATDLQGRTGLAGLFAAGEAARTGLHGGNRLASTSLLEGLVFGAAVGDFVGSQEGQVLRDHAASALSVGPNGLNGLNGHVNGSHQSPLEPTQIESTAHRAMQLLTSLRSVMWDHVGVVRTPSGLRIAKENLQSIREEADYLHATCPTLETAAMRDAAYAGVAVTEAALANRQSAGAHCLVPDPVMVNVEEDSYEDSDEEEQMIQMAAAR